MGTSIVLLIALIFAILVVFLRTPPALLANLIRGALPFALMGLGAVAMVFFRSFGLGAMLAFVGFTLWQRTKSVGRIPSDESGTTRSSVRSAALEMELDHDSGAMNGIVLVGRFEGAELDILTLEELYDLRAEIVGDGDSIGLLDSYLDRRFPQWREDRHADAGAGQTGTPGSGPMSEEEAYEVLGLPAGAGDDEVRSAHRKLMKTAHPDSGGSTFLAAKINEAKDVLLKSHS